MVARRCLREYTSLAVGGWVRWDIANMGTFSRAVFYVTVLSVHKRPVVGHADISFPMKGWRGMVDWARSSEDRVTIPKNILSTGKPGKSCGSSHVSLPLRHNPTAEPVGIHVTTDKNNESPGLLMNVSFDSILITAFWFWIQSVCT